MALNYAPQYFKFFAHVKSFNLNEGILVKSKRLSKTQIQIYGYIYGWNDDGYFCEVSMNKIAEYLNCSPTTVEKGIPKLEKLGWIKVVHGKKPEGSAKNVCNIYSVKRKPIAMRTPKAEKKPIQAKPKKTPAEIKNNTIWAIGKMMNQIGINHDDKKWIEERLRGS